VRAEADAVAPPAPVTPSSTAAPSSPLAGVRVLDLGLAVAGPWGTMMLADLGADVIKVNPLHDFYWMSTHIAMCCNRGKRSIAMNLKDADAMAILHELVATADVVQHNMRYEAAERLKIDYESLQAINPKLIYCHTRGFETGLRSGLPGNDQTGACLAGVQYEDGGMSKGGKPLWSFTSLGDTGNGFLSAISILQALYHRDRTGKGQFCDTSIVNAQLLNTSYVVARADGTGFERPRTDGMQLGRSATNRLYETRDGWLCLVLLREDEWQRFATAMGLPADARFASAASRAANDAALVQLLEPKFKQRTATEWFALLDKARVPCEVSDPKFSLGVHDDPEFKKRGWVVSYEHPFVGKLDQIGLLFDFSDTPGKVQGPPLIVGQHSREILAELGYTPEQIEELCKDCVLAWSLKEGHRKVRSPWQPQAPAAAAAEQKA
jgi:crotonobetainyl-CoA:carnitine CoA-transferase CaiB-like acyl-CoA transferase